MTVAARSSDAALIPDFQRDAGAGARAQAALRAWLALLALLVFAMVLVGGATRLTGSGLSITEWRPVTGALPPLSDEAWREAFEKYRRIPQYELLNKGMSLDAFKEIYWWEWSHRQLGRAIGLVFAIGFAGFWIAGALRGRLALAVLGVGLLGALQGAIGWLMVASGLKPGMTAVAPVKLMLHLTLASVILAALVWLAAGLSPLSGPRLPRRLIAGSRALVGLILVQIALGALVAGSKAGLVFNTWPLMDGRLVPPLDGLFVISPWVENFVDNVTLVQFNHRLAAVIVVGVALWHAIDARRLAPQSAAATRAASLAALLVAQAGVGVVTLLWMVPLGPALLHQGLAMAALALAAAHASLTRPLSVVAA